MAKGEVRITITGDESGWKRSLDRADDHLTQFAGKVSGIGGRLSGAFSSFIGNLGAIGVDRAISGIASMAGDALDEAEEAAKVSRVTGQLVKQTGADAWTSADQIDALSSRLSNLTAVDDEVIAQGANVLLTFKDVRNEVGKGNDIFDRATASGLDLSAVMGGDLVGANKMLGKALNDPERGITALTRAGVNFSDQQKEQIRTLVESGDKLSAQKLILQEIEGQVGGTAEASATATDKMKVMWGNVEEQLGTAVLPLLDKVGGFLADRLPPLIDFVTDKVGNIGSAIASLVEGDFAGAGVDIGKLFGFEEDSGATDFIIGVLDTLGAGVTRVVDFVTGAASVISSTISGLFSGDTAGAGVDIGKLFGLEEDSAGTDAIIGVLDFIRDAVAATVDRVRWYWGRISAWWEDHGDAVIGAVSTVVSAVASVLSALFDAAQVAWNKVGKPVVDLVLKVFGDVVDWFRAHADDIAKPIQNMARKIGPIIARVAEVISTVLGWIRAAWAAWGDEILAVALAVWNAIAGVVSGAMDVIKGILDVVMGIIHGDWSRVWDGLRSIVSGVWRAITAIISAAWSAIKAVFSALYDGVKAVLGAAFKWLLESAGEAVEGFFNFFASLPNRIGGALLAVYDGITSILGRAWDWITSTAGAAVESVVGFFTGLPDRLAGLIAGVYDAVTGALGKAWDWMKSTAGDAVEAVVGFFRGLPSRIGNLISGVVNFLTAPFREAFNAIADMWNSTVGKISFHIPGTSITFDVLDLPTFRAPATPTAPAGVKRPIRDPDRRALGGPVTAGSVYQFIERGYPEVVRDDRGNSFLVPGRDGHVDAMEPLLGLHGQGQPAPVVNIHEGAVQISVVATPDVDPVEFGRKVREGLEGYGRHNDMRWLDQLPGR